MGVTNGAYIRFINRNYTNHYGSSFFMYMVEIRGKLRSTLLRCLLGVCLLSYQ